MHVPEVRVRKQTVEISARSIALDVPDKGVLLAGEEGRDRHVTPVRQHVVPGQAELEDDRWQQQRQDNRDQDEDSALDATHRGRH
jgi:hypothetical protein